MAARSGFDGVLLDPATGEAVENVEWEVYKADGVTSATIYGSKSGADILPTTNTTSSNGVISFWVAPGFYQISIVDPSTKIASRVIPFNAVAGDDDGISLDQIDFGTGLTTSYIGDQQVTTAKIKDDDVTQAKMATNSIGTPEAKFVLEFNTGSSSAGGNQVIASDYLQPGVYYVEAKIAGGTGGTGIWNIVATGGSATITESGATAVSAGNIRTCKVTVSSATTVQVTSDSTGTRTGFLYVIGMEN